MGNHLSAAVSVQTIGNLEHVETKPLMVLMYFLSFENIQMVLNPNIQTLFNHNIINNGENKWQEKVFKTTVNHLLRPQEISFQKYLREVGLVESKDLFERGLI